MKINSAGNGLTRETSNSGADLALSCGIIPRGEAFYNNFIPFTGYVLLIIICTFIPLRKVSAQVEKPYFTDIGQLNYAKFLMNEHDYPSAAREFARLIENFPGSPYIAEAQFRMAEAYFKAGRYHDAEEEYKLFLSNFGENPSSAEAKKKMLEASKMSVKEEPENLPLVPLPEEKPSVPGMRAVQVALFEGRNYDEVEKEIRHLKDSGIDTIIVRVFHNMGDRFYPFVAGRERAGVYFKTSHSPVVEDILTNLAAIAHRNGLKIFAWMTTRYADYGVEADAGLACKGYDILFKKLFRCRGLDLFNEKAVKRLEAIYGDLADYDIDGILFQDDLFLRHNEGFGTHMEALYRNDYGDYVDPESFYLHAENNSVHYTQPFWEWASWKNKRLLEVAGRLRKTVRKKRPDVKFAVNLMYESVTNPPFALAWLSQNLAASYKMGFDYYSIMAYHRQMEQELKRDPEEVRGLIERLVKDAVKIVGEPRRVLIKLQTIDWKTGKPLSNGEVVSLIRDVKSIKDVSLAVVPYRGDFPFHELTLKSGVASFN